MINEFDHTKNFWRAFPDLKSVFTRLYKSDKTKNHNSSSKAMWAIALVYHPSSPYAAEKESTKKKIAEEELGLKGSRYFSWKKFEPTVDRFIAVTTTKAEKFLMMWEKELEDRFALIQSIPYSLDTPHDLIKFKEGMMGQTDRLWAQYEKFKKTDEEFKEYENYCKSNPDYNPLSPDRTASNNGDLTSSHDPYADRS